MKKFSPELMFFKEEKQGTKDTSIPWKKKFIICDNVNE